MHNFSSLKNRTYCDCLMEIRDFLPHTKLTEKDTHVIMSLVEELQTYGNRMEAAIYDTKDMMSQYKTLKGLKAAIRGEEGKLRRLKDELRETKKALKSLKRKKR